MLLNAITTTNITAPVMASDRPSFESMLFLMVYNGHNGDVTRIPKPIRYHTLNDFKQFIYESLTNYMIDGVDNIFLLASFGIKLNFSIINEINEVYVYDKRMFNKSDSLVNDYFEQNLGNFNNLMIEFKQLRDETVLPNPSNSIKTMSSNLKRFQSWSQILLNHCIKTNELIKNHYLKQVNNIFKSLNVIFQFINNFINDIEKGFNNYYSYIKLLNLKSLHKSWSTHYSNLKKFPLIKLKSLGHSINLADFVNLNELSRNSQFVGTHLPLILNKLNEMVETINGINKEKYSIDKTIEEKRNKSIKHFKVNMPEEIIKQFRDKVNEISKSLESLDNSDDSIQEIYDMNQNFYQDVIHLARNMNDCLNQTLNFKLDLCNSSFEILNTISNLQMEIVSVKNDMKLLYQPSSTTDPISYNTVEEIKKAEDYLSLCIDLPLLFGFILIEKRRQFEWYDFYSKGIINNITEQLTTIIDHEKIFQKLWLKKFGNFVSLLQSENTNLKPSLPNLDVTLINNHQNSVFLLLKDVEIQREDLLDYISMVEKFENKYDSTGNRKFTDHLNGAFKDLVKSTNNMKLVTKLVTSISNFTSPNEEMSNSKLKNLIENDGEFNDNLVKGLKSRIRKLEDLLHQQQFKNLANWPVTTGYNSRKGSPAPGSSLLVRQPSQKDNDKPRVPNPKVEKVSSQSPPTEPRSPTNPTSLLRKNSSSTRLDASVTIDKHLDNLRLKKENKELEDENNKLKNGNKKKDLEIHQLLKQIEDLKEDKSKFSTEVENMRLSQGKAISDIQRDHESDMSKKDMELKDLREQLTHHRTIVSEYRSINESKDQKLKDFGERIELQKHEIKDLMRMKDDILSNMTSKELDHIRSTNNYENEIKELKTKIEELSEECENLIEANEKKVSNPGTIRQLNVVIEQLIKDILSSLDLNYEFFYQFCLVLESIGLLLIKEYNEDLKQDEYKITRVKGLRSKKSEDVNTTNGDVSLLSGESKPSTTVISDISNLMEWTKRLKPVGDVLDSASNDDVKSLSTNLDEIPGEEAYELSKSIQLINTFEKYFLDSGGKISNFEETLQTISFKDEDLENFFLSAISKRFRDVEGFAKKLTKETKVKTQDLNKMSKEVQNKISMKNFKVGDLALFLPTRIESVAEVNLKHQPWAAFNIGAPHYFLNNLNDTTGDWSEKEWLVARIVNLHEFKVSDSNVNNENENPFKLSIGITWYLVDVKEENNL